MASFEIPTAIEATSPALIGVGPPPTEIPLFMHAFIERYVNDPADAAQCGFNSIALSLGLGEGSWAKVRSDLNDEARKNLQLYEDVVDDRKVQNVIERIDWFESEPGEEHWFCLPDMGHMVATCYQCVFSVIGDSTYLPLISSPETNVNNIPIICIAYLKSTRHFVSVKLSPSAPLPPLSLLWPRNQDDSVDGLEQKLSQRFDDYKVGLRGSI